MAGPAFIATPLPEELLYSVIARTQTMALYDSPATLSFTLFGKRSVPATIDLPGHLDFFANSVADIFPFTSREIIEQLTLWSFYSRFIKHANREDVIQLMLNGGTEEIHVKAGLNQSSLPTRQNLMYCPLCVLEDLRLYGMSYWHRIHQVPAILICPKHKVFLVTYVPKTYEEARSYYIDSNLVSLETANIKTSTNRALIDLASEVESILLGKSTFDVGSVNYLQHLRAQYGKGKNLDRRQLVLDFRNYYDSIGEDDDSWVISIVRRPSHYFHPIRHLLMSLFIKSLMVGTKSTECLFGKGPWKCLNKASDHFGQPVITKVWVHVDRKSQRQIAVLECDCGMIYSLSHEDNMPIGTRYTRILEWGGVWQERLRAELQSGKSLRAIAKLLGTDAKTVSKYKELPKREDNLKLNLELTKKQRIKWQKLLGEFDTNRISQARKADKALYAWLHRNDIGWLKLVNSQMNVGKPGSSELRLDWGRLDEQIVTLITATVSKLRKENFRGRITKSLISKIIKYQHFLLGKNSGKLPKSVELLNKEAETREEFIWRRIEESLVSVSENGSAAKWKVMRKAGLSRSSWSSTIEEKFNKKLYG